MTASDNHFQILALDGGGIKGLFSAAILAFIEDHLKTRITEHFDLITGTSTGGIIALGLGKGLPAKEIVEFYVSEGVKIFPQYSLSSVVHKVRTKYSNDQLKKCLQGCFKDTLIGDSKTRLVIPSYNISADDIYLFKTPHHKRLKTDYKLPMWKVGMATSAAPTYFPAFSEINGMRLVDGGVWANNPTMVGIVEAISLLEVPPSSIKVLNLGTTDPVKARPKNLSTGGQWQWREEGVDVILRGQSRGAYTHAQLLLGKDRVVRLDPVVADGEFELDKLDSVELISKAAHYSRQLLTQFENMFFEHTPKKFVPLYSVKEHEDA